MGGYVLVFTVFPKWHTLYVLLQIDGFSAWGIGPWLVHQLEMHCSFFWDASWSLQGAKQPWANVGAWLSPNIHGRSLTDALLMLSFSFGSSCQHGFHGHDVALCV